MKKYLWYILVVAVSVAIIWILLTTLSWTDVRTAWKTITWIDICIILAGVLSINILKAARIFISLRFANVEGSFPKVASVFMASQLFTPLPAGEVGRGVYLKGKLDVHARDVAGPVLLQALTELGGAAICMLVAGFFVSEIGWIASLALVFFLFLLSAPLIFSKNFNRLLTTLKEKGFVTGWIEKIRSALHELNHFFSLQTPSARVSLGLKVLFLAVASQLVGGGLLWYIALQQNQPVTVMQGIFAAAVSVLIAGIVFIIPGGLGFTESGLAGILKSYGIPWPIAILITALFRLATFVVPIILAVLMLGTLAIRKLVQKLTPQ